MGENKAGKKVEYIIDDSPIVIPEYIKNMSKEKLESEIARLEKRDEKKETVSAENEAPL